MEHIDVPPFKAHTHREPNDRVYDDRRRTESKEAEPIPRDKGRAAIGGERDDGIADRRDSALPRSQPPRRRAMKVQRRLSELPDGPTLTIRTVPRTSVAALTRPSARRPVELAALIRRSSRHLMERSMPDRGTRDVEPSEIAQRVTAVGRAAHDFRRVSPH